MKIYYINLNSDIERRQRIQGIFSSLNINAKRVEAIDGRTTSFPLKDKYQPPIESRVFFTRDLSNAEIACYLSHLKCMRQLLLDDDDWAFIMEDDIEISSKIIPLIRDASWIPENVKLVQLSSTINPGKTIYHEKDCYKINDCFKLIRIVKPISTGCLGYLIHKDIAQQLINDSGYIKAPIDEILFAPYFGYVSLANQYSMIPCLIKPKEGMCSSIGKRPVGYGPYLNPYVWIRRRVNALKKTFKKYISIKDKMRYAE